jgi:small-conductance mechanosensitive channel
MNTYIEWFKHHERLIFGILIALVLVFGVHRVLGYLEHRDQRIYDKDKAVLQAQVDATAAVAKQNAALAQQYADLAQKVLNENTKLEQAITARDTATKKQQTADQALAPSDLATRWTDLAGLPIGAVKPAGDLYTITDAGARRTTVVLERIPELEADLVDKNTELANAQKQVTAAEGRVTGLTGEVDGLHKQIGEADKACKDQVALVKTQARKSKWAWFGRGAIVGAIVWQIISHGGLSK